MNFYTNGTPIVISDMLVGGSHNAERMRVPDYIGHTLILPKRQVMYFYQPDASIDVIDEREMYERRTAQYCYDAAPVDHFVIQGMADRDAWALLKEHSA